jgi:hypothetical protein
MAQPLSPTYSNIGQPNNNYVPRIFSWKGVPAVEHPVLHDNNEVEEKQYRELTISFLTYGEKYGFYGNEVIIFDGKGHFSIATPPSRLCCFCSGPLTDPNLLAVARLAKKEIAKYCAEEFGIESAVLKYIDNKEYLDTDMFVDIRKIIEKDAKTLNNFKNQPFAHLYEKAEVKEMLCDLCDVLDKVIQRIKDDPSRRSDILSIFMTSLAYVPEMAKNYRNTTDEDKRHRRIVVQMCFLYLEVNYTEEVANEVFKGKKNAKEFTAGMFCDLVEKAKELKSQSTMPVDINGNALLTL